VSSAAAIAWLDGRWGSPDELSLPLSDRGLLFADGVFETVLVEGGEPCLLDAHLKRWRDGAALLGMQPPPPPARVERLTREAIARSGLTGAALRLNWSRGSLPPGARGIDLPPEGTAPGGHRFWLTLSPAAPCFDPVRVIVSPTESRHAGSLLSRCKTFAYGPSIQARRQARQAGVDDALLTGTDGGLCCGTTANLLMRLGDAWLTPPLGSGCLPGVMRGRALALGLAREAAAPVLPVDLLEAARGGRGAVLLLINSLGCRPVLAVEGVPLPVGPAPEPLFRALVGPS
jgi:branched-subunit amino acid aminotransferase/4-amino-4-deoxychorismate lyase